MGETTDDTYVALNKLLAAMNLLRYKWLILDILVDKEWILRILSCLRNYGKYRVAQKKRPEHSHALWAELSTDF